MAVTKKNSTRHADPKTLFSKLGNDHSHNRVGSGVSPFDLIGWKMANVLFRMVEGGWCALAGPFLRSRRNPEGMSLNCLLPGLIFCVTSTRTQYLLRLHTRFPIFSDMEKYCERGKEMGCTMVWERYQTSSDISHTMVEPGWRIALRNSSVLVFSRWWW